MGKINANENNNNNNNNNNDFNLLLRLVSYGLS
jgi:hypothetical protein